MADGRVQVESLFHVGANPHSYQPVSADAVKISKSTVLFVNGFGYDNSFVTVVAGVLRGGGFPCMLDFTIFRDNIGHHAFTPQDFVSKW